MSLRALDLFSGIGGITYGLRGIVTPVVYVEKDPNAREFLKKKHPEIPVFEDVCEFDASEWKGKVDIITAGWPCTGFSTAGKGTGFAHEASGLFTEIIRIAKECEPKFLFLENSHVLNKVENTNVILNAFDALGYDCKWMTCRATIVGAPHQRHRWFCLVTKHGRDASVELPPFEIKFNWGVNEPPKQIKDNTAENKFILGVVGNAVVPDQVRYAFYTLLGKECTVIPSEPLNIILSPREVKEHKAQENNIVTEQVFKNWWGTPCHSYQGHTLSYRILTKRGLGHLPTQVSFSQYGTGGYHLHGLWCAWLMGYPNEYFTC
jgi:DNA-cytosine methyltransferase